MSSEKTKKRSSGKTSHTENQVIILSAPANLHFVFGLISSFLEVVTEFAFYFFYNVFTLKSQNWNGKKMYSRRIVQDRTAPREKAQLAETTEFLK